MIVFCTMLPVPAMAATCAFQPFLQLLLPSSERRVLFRTDPITKELIRHPEYKSLIRGAKLGSSLVFSNGSEFKIKKLIALEDSDAVFETAQGTVLRVEYNRPETINEFLDDEAILAQEQIPRPRIISSKRGEFVEEELVQVNFDLWDYLSGKQKLNRLEQAELDRKFVEFATRFKNFEDISDFHSGQVVYTDKGWMLLDWGGGHSMGTALNPFSGAFFVMERRAQKYRPHRVDRIMDMSDKVEIAIKRARGQIKRGRPKKPEAADEGWWLKIKVQRPEPQTIPE